MVDYTKSVPTVHNSMCEFYLHGFSLGHHWFSFFNLYIVELHFQLFISFMQNKKEWDDRNDRFIEMQVRVSYPKKLLFIMDFNVISQIGGTTKVYKRNLKKIIGDYRDVINCLTFQACSGIRERYKSIIPKIRRSELMSPHNFIWSQT